MAASKAQRAATAERRSRAVRLRIAGMDWEAIADQLGYASRGAACTDVTRAMERHVAAEKAEVEVLRQQELDRLNRLQAGLWTAATGGDAQSAEVVRKIIMDRCKVLGLAAPQRHELLTIDAIDAQIRDLQLQLAGND
jgi:hypothetical protein